MYGASCNATRSLRPSGIDPCARNYYGKWTRRTVAFLHELQFDGRLSNKELAERTHASESACLRHRHRLEATGLIAGYIAVVDQALAGYPETVFVEVSLRSQNAVDLAAFEKALRDIPEVMECYLLSGDADYLLRVVCVEASHFDRVRERLAKLPEIARMHSYFALRQVVKKTELPLRV